MDCKTSDFFAWFTFLIFVVTLFTTLIKTLSRLHRPPGPLAWPLLGNILVLGKNPHQSLYKLRFKYGDLLWLKLGCANTLVVQTAKANKELFKNHDAFFCNRIAPDCWAAHNYYEGSIAVGQYGSNWRILRKLVTLGLMTSKQIQASLSLRQKCLDDMIRFIEEDSVAARLRGESGEIQLSNYLFVMSFNLIGNLVFSKDVVDLRSEEGNELFHAMDKVMEYAGKVNLADFFPVLKMLDPQRIKSNMERHLGRTLSIVEEFVIERIEDQKLTKERGFKDFLDVLLEHNESSDGGKEAHQAISTHNMLILVLEMFIGGTETVTTTIEWVMTELLRSPQSMLKVKEELNRVVGPARKVNESDIDQLDYLQAVIQETMRLHPVLTLIPRNTLGDINFMGYFIPKNTKVFINAWAIGRDPDAWEDFLSFKPERFLGSHIQYKGQAYDLIPFGAGRRICVGFPLAHQVLHLSVASLLHCFDWEIEDKSAKEATDMNEMVWTCC